MKIVITVAKVWDEDRRMAGCPLSEILVMSAISIVYDNNPHVRHFRHFHIVQHLLVPRTAI